MPVAISVEHLSKQYQIGNLHRATTIGERVMQLVRHPFGIGERNTTTLEALKDVSFSVGAGEVLGIIGRNGAGKSTLLKILSRITRQTSGRIHVSGRVASLLEVGTGFHEELTGRENIYLCGSILGMPKKRISARLDEIIAFAGVEKFIDTPIKRYSSGMRLRLGFAVAANLESDILIVDEVLAVGDGEFQKKCLQSMENMHKGGRTVLFVSHNLPAVENLCSRTVWLDQGAVREDGAPHEVIQHYMETFAASTGQSLDLRTVATRQGSGRVRFTRLEYLDADKQPVGLIRTGDTLTLRIHYTVHEPVENPIFGCDIHTPLGTTAVQVHTYSNGFHIPLLVPGEHYIDVRISDLNLMPGRYYLSLYVANLGNLYHDLLEHCTVLDVEPSTRYGFVRGMTKNPIMVVASAWELPTVNGLASAAHDEANRLADPAGTAAPTGR